jgi:hypothetical protein
VRALHTLAPTQQQQLQTSNPQPTLHTHRALWQHAGLWATLQFKWIQLQYPAVVLAFEKLLMTGSFPVAACMQTWGIAAGVGMTSAPFFAAAIMCGLYYLLARPAPSSFHLAPKRIATGGWALQFTHTFYGYT